MVCKHTPKFYYTPHRPPQLSQEVEPPIRTASLEKIFEYCLIKFKDIVFVTQGH